MNSVDLTRNAAVARLDLYMIRIFRHYVPGSLLLIGLLEHLLLVASMYMALMLRWADSSNVAATLMSYLPEAIFYATTLIFTMFALGLYSKEYVRDIGTIFTRLLFSFLFGYIILATIYFIFPSLSVWRSAFVLAFAFSLAGIVTFRWMFLRFSNLEALRRKILVLGVGNKAVRIEKLEQEGRRTGFACSGFVTLNDQSPVIDESRCIRGNRRLSDIAREQGAEEIIVALDERRGALPVDALLDCKLAGMEIMDFSTFWERETGRVDLESLNPSWLIFSDGFVGGWLQAFAKRLFDIVASVALLIFSLPLLCLTAVMVRLESPGPVLYRQERVGLNNETFMLLKFRSMREDAEKDGNPQWAAVNDSRVTRIGAFMRKSRIDELPQIINVLKGEMSFIGPRPERPYFVEKLSAIIPYYGERHRVKPGISGWAQLNFPYGASDEDAKQKFQYDLYYIKNYSLFLDLIVLIQTVRVVLWPVGAR